MNYKFIQGLLNNRDYLIMNVYIAIYIYFFSNTANFTLSLSLDIFQNVYMYIIILFHICFRTKHFVHVHHIVSDFILQFLYCHSI